MSMYLTSVQKSWYSTALFYFAMYDEILIDSLPPYLWHKLVDINIYMYTYMWLIASFLKSSYNPE